MNMGSRKVNTEGIDEELLIASIGRRKQDGTLYRAQEPPAPAPKEESVPESEQSGVVVLLPFAASAVFQRFLLCR